ncbi:MAG: hypothetical protein ABI690_28890 [Chloroflexota bacterium]
MSKIELENLQKEIIVKRKTWGNELVQVDFKDLTGHDKTQDQTFLKNYFHSLNLDDFNAQLYSVDTHSGLEQLIGLLYKDVLHHHPAMPLRWAAELAAKFVAPFDDSKTRCYSNHVSLNLIDGHRAILYKSVIFIDDKLVGLVFVGEEVVD